MIISDLKYLREENLKMEWISNNKIIGISYKLFKIKIIIAAASATIIENKFKLTEKFLYDFFFLNFWIFLVLNICCYSNLLVIFIKIYSDLNFKCFF